MRAGRVVEEINYEGLPASFADFICYQYRKLALQELRFHIGDEKKFIEFLNNFAGSYIMLPTGKKLMTLTYDYLAALTVLKIKNAKRNKDLRDWNRQEEALQKIAKKLGRKYRYVYLRGIKILRDLDKVSKWIKGLENWKAKFIGGKDEVK